MIDYEEVRNYLQRLGFAESGINTYISSYLHPNKIAILNNFDDYKNLTDEEKIMKFADDKNILQTEFDRYHQYSKEFTFSDVKSGAKRYKLYKQYQGIMKTIQRYNENPAAFETNGASWFFKILDDDKSYPIKAIIRENIKLLDLKENFTTHQAIAKLKKIFNFKGNDTNVEFFDMQRQGDRLSSDKFSNEQIEVFTNIAKEKNLRYHCSSSKRYFQIYSKYAPETEGTGGVHYEFYKKNDHSYGLFIHVEKRANNGDYKNLRESVFGLNNRNKRTVYSIDIENDDNVQEVFDHVYHEYEEKINKFYLNHKQNKEGNLNMQEPLNQILFGPPGTGKTYHTVDKALQIIDGYIPKNRDEAKKRFEALKENGQIEFVTFHQSYGYEEFVEGIKPCDLDNCESNNNDIQYSVQSGIFKKMVKKAKRQYEFSEDLNQINFNNYLSVGQEFETKHGKKFKITKIDDDIYFHQGSGEHRALGKTILELLDDEDIMLNDEYYSSQVYIAREIYKKLNKNGDLSKKYVLIVDEINRGNISKIFGELITLVEESKRLGNDEAMEVTLPYSGEKFGVPNNLYIIGTMNTADRSIALMDTALRRRFEFVEMMPKPKLLKGVYIESVDIEKLLVVINKRIEYLYDRDHTIGHSYFMTLKDDLTIEALSSIFKNKVIPLLQEYFYDDWEKIRLVLGDNDHVNEEFQFVTIKSGYDVNSLFGSIQEMDIDYDTKVYEINDGAFKELESYIKIYG